MHVYICYFVSIIVHLYHNADVSNCMGLMHLYKIKVETVEKVDFISTVDLPKDLFVERRIPRWK